ncbi:MAG: hypothetical protein IAI48_19085, partial [Candidatus Eremiobacteraeota bacterium]|nr:hypothetical protein [Candidatus Eremiobacteraeota bacterium]
AQRVSGLDVRPAPAWMRVRLALAGQRPISNLVDISNFVMLETAQPLHFYDFDRLAGGELIARDARPGETIRTLDGANRPLDPRFLVIADDREPQSVAGLMGGAGSEVTAATRELLVEAATFSGPRVRRMSVALGLRTAASARHEKGLPPGLAPWGAARAAHLLQLEGATVHAPFEATPAVKLAPPKPVRISLARFPALLGIEIAEAEAVAALSHLGFEAHATADDSQIGEAPRRCLDVTPPPWRGDVTIAEDVVEEVARIVGYDRIVAHMPPILDQEVSSAEYRAESRVAHALAELGFREAVTLALQPRAIGETYVNAGVAVPGGAVEILNPISEEQRFLRFSLVPALLALAQRYGADDSFRAFEVGHTFATGVEAATVETPEAVWLAAMPATDAPSWRDGGFLGFKGEAVALVRSLTGRTPEAVAAA